MKADLFFCHAVSAFVVLKKVSCGRNVFSDYSVNPVMEFSSFKCYYTGVCETSKLLCPNIFLATLSNLSWHFCIGTTRD